MNLKTGDSESPGPRRHVWENIMELCWKGAGVLVFAWGIYVLFLVFSTHPCWQSSDCWAALVMGSQNAQKFQFVDPEAFSPYSNSKSSNNSNPTSLDHIVFGIATSADKWWQRKQYVDLWWQPGKSRGYVWLDRATQDPWPSDSPPFRISEDTSHFKFTHPNAPRSAIRISRIVTEAVRLGLPNVRWFVMGDDDTVFFTDNLIKVLNKYDHNQFYYIGSNSEAVEQNLVHSYAMAYGGGGFAISYPLAKALSRIQDDCLDRYSNLYGSDQRVHGCLAELGVPLTREPGFHQVDVHGNLMGLIAAHPQAPLVSLHHLDAVSPLFPGMTRAGSLRHLMEAMKADPDRVAQQSICYDRERKWTVSVAWGYCVHIYGRVELPRLLEYPLETFYTWKSWGRPPWYPFVFNSRPISREPCENPVVLYMENVGNSTFGGHVSLYSQRDQLGSKRCNATKNNPAEVKRVKIVSHRMMAEMTEAPRRQCCEILSSKNSDLEINSDLQIHIRRCRVGESMSPP
uniref:Uncharacterized protein n=1 Tax=Araucaria cunninghamii TaxID=56994 RepID=A0A0D6QRV0_ARACU